MNRPKRAAALALACVLGVGALAGAQDFKYVRSSLVLSQNRVAVKSLQDFLDFAKAHRVTTIYALDPDPQGDRIEEFYAWADGLFWSIKANGYQTLADYAAGLRLGFASGADFAAARELGIASKDEFEYWSAERYLSVKDMKAAIAAGFRGKGKALDSYIFPRRVPERQFEGPVMDALLFASLMEGISVPLNASARELAARHGVKLPTVGFSVTLGIKGQERDKAEAWLAFLRDYISREGKLGRIEYRKADRDWISAAATRFPGTGSDASLYYLARAYGSSREAELAARYSPLASGYDSKQDEAAAGKAGFAAADDWYAALAAGFDSARDWSGARTLGLADAKAWLPVRERVREIADAMSRYGLSSWPDALLAWTLAGLPPGKPAPLERIAEMAGLWMDANKDIRKLFGDRVSSAWVAETLAARRAELSRLGDWDAEAKVFNRKP